MTIGRVQLRLNNAFPPARQSLNKTNKSADMSSPGGSKLSASSSLNAAIAAKKEAERKAAEEKAAKLASKLAANKPVDPTASGWWATSEAGLMNDNEEQKKEAKAAGFSTQYALTGQSGMGSSLFKDLHSTASAPASGEHAVSSPTAVSSSSNATTDAAAAQLASAIDTSLRLSIGSPPKTSAPAPGQEDKANGWWSQMDNSLLNKDEEAIDKKAKQGFTPQFIGGSGLVNRLVPLGSPTKTDSA